MSAQLQWKPSYPSETKPSSDPATGCIPNSSQAGRQAYRGYTISGQPGLPEPAAGIAQTAGYGPR
jgi:acyl-homoserine lactone acylase PvdQ